LFPGPFASEYVGDYRVVYTIKDADLVVLALRVAHRSPSIDGRSGQRSLPRIRRRTLSERTGS